ncbi:acylphosphatase [Methanospirillum stamsii]|uniref:acylphosphatase n=1 Tax=Methanospirillum stamsii TaxID=1277351 RepID=UPI0015E86649|nr:acylphosphatase [Methanospirillum stamsii]
MKSSVSDTGIVRNCSGYDVEIIAEGNEADLDQFISQIKIIEEPICVESIKIESGTYDGKWKYFEIQRGNPDEELGERLDAALTYLVRIDYNSRRSVKIGEQMLDKQDQMLANQDYQISLQKVTNQEIQEMRSDLKDSIHTKYQFIEQRLH